MLNIDPKVSLNSAKVNYFCPMEVNRFNIRVYGILIDEQKRVLVTDELIKGNPITKLPGGGLEFGEGTIDCIKREFMEETNNAVEVTGHFYTTDYFQVSAYNKAHQIISIYYLVKPVSTFQLKSTEKVFDFGEDKRYIQTFRWIPLKAISENDFTLAIDKVVGKMLKEQYAGG
jgi:ADP-ribose pyrophosphatase YjhB (NUDIX family)